jgi:hypothetical protein
LRGPVGGCGFGDVGETDGVLKRKNVAKVKVVGDLAVTGHLSLMGIMAFGPRMALI